MRFLITSALLFCSQTIFAETEEQAIQKHILTIRTNHSVNAKKAAREALVDIGLPSLGPLMDCLHQIAEAKPNDEMWIYPGYVEDAICAVCKRVGPDAERAILKRFLQTANEKERKLLFGGLVGGSSYPKALAHLLDAIRAEGALHGNAKWGVEQVVHLHVHGGWGRDEAAIAELLGIFSSYPDLEKEHGEIRQHLMVLRTVGAPKKETTFSPVKHRTLPIVVDEMTEFFVALPMAAGFVYHWGVGKGRKPDLDWRDHGLLYLGRVLGKDKVYFRLVGVRALKTPLNAYVQGGVPDDDPAEYPMTLTVRALPPEERAKRLRELLSSFDERKRKYAEPLLSEEKPSVGKENAPDEADAERKKAKAEREAEEERKKADAQSEADKQRKKAHAERKQAEAKRKAGAERKKAEEEQAIAGPVTQRKDELQALHFFYPSQRQAGSEKPAVYAIPMLSHGKEYDYLRVYHDAARGKYGKPQANSRFSRQVIESLDGIWDDRGQLGRSNRYQQSLSVQARAHENTDAVPVGSVDGCVPSGLCAVQCARSAGCRDSTRCPAAGFVGRGQGPAAARCDVRRRGRAVPD